MSNYLQVPLYYSSLNSSQIDALKASIYPFNFAVYANFEHWMREQLKQGRDNPPPSTPGLAAHWRDNSAKFYTDPIIYFRLTGFEPLPTALLNKFTWTILSPTATQFHRANPQLPVPVFRSYLLIPAEASKLSITESSATHVPLGFFFNDPTGPYEDSIGTKYRSTFPSDMTLTSHPTHGPIGFRIDQFDPTIEPFSSLIPAGPAQPTSPLADIIAELETILLTPSTAETKVSRITTYVTKLKGPL